MDEASTSAPVFAEMGRNLIVTATLRTGSYIIDDRERGVFKVNRDAFTSDEVLRRERELIFNKCWLFLGHASELKNPNDYLLRSVGGQEVIFNRDRKGEFHAFFNVCPHRGAQVAREKCGNAIAFKCFYHGWAFNNNGKFSTRSQPGVYPTDFGEDGSVDLAVVPRLESYRDFFFVNFDHDAVPLPEYLAQSKEMFDILADHSPNGMEIVGGVQEYSIRANWKLLVENSYDGFHAVQTHETYFDYLTKHIGPDHVAKAVANISRPGASRALDFGNGHAAIETIAAWGRPIARSIPPWGEEGKAKAEALMKELEARVGPERAVRIGDRDRNIGIFPNLVLNDIMAITVRTFYPIAPNLMEVNSWALAPVGEDPVTRKHRLDNFLEFLGPGGFATPDDVEALESAQRGYASSRFSPWNDISRGVLKEQPAADDEAQMRSFWRQWDRLMRGAE